MKTKALLLTLFNLIFLNGMAQDITVNITTGHNPQVCASTNFHVEVTVTGNTNLSSQYFGIEDIAGLTFSGNPTSATINSVNYKLYPLTGLSFNFQISYACSFIPQTNTVGQVV